MNALAKLIHRIENHKGNLITYRPYPNDSVGRIDIGDDFHLKVFSGKGSIDLLHDDIKLMSFSDEDSKSVWDAIKAARENNINTRINSL